MSSQTFNPELLESASPRDFVVAMRTKDGFARGKADRKLLVVKATSIAKAKEAALRKAKTGKHKHTIAAAWVFDSVQDAASNNEIIGEVKDE